MSNTRYYYGGPVVVTETFEDKEIIESNDFLFEFIRTIGIITVFFIISIKAVISIINFIEDIYTDYICYKCFYENTILPDLKIREQWCRENGWIVEWYGHQRLSIFRDMDGKWIYTNTDTCEEYITKMDGTHPDGTYKGFRDD